MKTETVYQNKPRPGPPASLEELNQRAQALAHTCFADLLQTLGSPCPNLQPAHKGFVGQCLEYWLGATAGNESAPDFQSLGVELKTLPIRDNGRVKESTYVCTAPLTGLHRLDFAHSPVAQKLRHVLWVPLVQNNYRRFSEIKIHSPFFWQPSWDDWQILQQDYDELTTAIAMGELQSITAAHGTYLQLRPKAADGRVLTRGIAASGAVEATLPRGFYLRTRFTQRLLEQQGF